MQRFHPGWATLAFTLSAACWTACAESSDDDAAPTVRPNRGTASDEPSLDGGTPKKRKSPTAPSTVGTDGGREPASATPPKDATPMPSAPTPNAYDASTTNWPPPPENPSPSTPKVTSACPEDDPSYALKALFEMSRPNFKACTSGCSSEECCAAGQVCVRR